jgi:hypothetical protein
MRRACACGGGCPRCQKKSALTVSEPGDALEQEADHVAEQIMRASPLPAGDDQERSPTRARLSLARMATRSVPTQDMPASVRSGLHSPGRPLDAATREFFEPRFGRDLGSVRVHTDASAAQSARHVQAQAYTVGRDVVFDTGRYAPATVAGQRLLAHELTHVVQQSASSHAPRMQRLVDPAHVHCAPNVAGAWDDPVAALTSMDDIAHDFALRMSNSLFLAAVALPGDPGSVRANVLSAYRRRFGSPQAASGGFRDRFSGAVLPSLDAAETSELNALSDRFQRVAEYLTHTITYSCRDYGAPFTMPPCGSATCQPGQAYAYDCFAGGPRRISLCPDFWSGSRGLEDGAMTMIHETMHMLFHLRWHGSTTATQRGRNPSCYDNFVADMLGYPTSSAYCDPVP